MEGNWSVYFCVKNREVAYSYFNIDIAPPLWCCEAAARLGLSGLSHTRQDY